MKMHQREPHLISTRLRSGAIMRTIAKEMRQSASIIGREVSRNNTMQAGACRPSKVRQCAQPIGTDKHHCVLTLVERKTGLAIVKKLANRSMAEVN